MNDRVRFKLNVFLECLYLLFTFCSLPDDSGCPTDSSDREIRPERINGFISGLCYESLS